MPDDFLVATFLRAGDVCQAVRALRHQQFWIYDVYSPYPIHGLDQAMGIRKTRLPGIALAGALLGLISAAALQFYTAVMDWPLNVGGKPDNSTLAFLPICFELTVLFSGLLTVAALFLRSRMYPGRRERCFAEGATEDVFVVALRKRPTLDFNLARALLEQCGASDVAERRGRR